MFSGLRGKLNALDRGPFSVAKPVAAYDAKSGLRRANDQGGAAATKLLRFLESKLTEDEFREVERLLAAEGVAEDDDPYPIRDEDDLLDEFAGDEPPIFSGRPRVGGGQDPLRTDKLRPAMDGAASFTRVSDSYKRMFPGALRIGVIPTGQDPDNRRARLAMDGATEFGSASANYRAMFPEAAHIKVIP
jgi:hypothetical protein